MGAVGGLVGLGGGAAGTNFAGPSATPLIVPTNAQQLSSAYTGVQGGLTGQQNLLAALQAQQGIQNQSQVYGQLQGVASGAVNPAQAQFNQNTAANVANQSALMAGQRGAASNVGLMARQAAQQGAATQQQAVGQEAAQQAQNQIAAIGAAGNLATTQAGQQIGQTNANAQAQLAEQQALFGATQGYNSAQVAQQSNINNANASLAGTQMQGQQGLLGGAMNAAGAALAGGGEVKKMKDGGWSQVGQTVGGGNDYPTQESQTTAQPTFDPNDNSYQQINMGATAPASAPQSSDGKSKFGQFLKGMGGGSQAQPAQGFMPKQPTAGAQALQAGATNFGTALGKKLKSSPNQQDQGSDSTDVSANAPVYNPVGGQATSPDAMGITSTFGEPQAAGGMIKDFRVGGKVNAGSGDEKAVKRGNDYANDKIPAILSEHEIVLPRSVTMSPDPVSAAAKFVSDVVAKRKVRK
jgi:hypothetical protein